MVLHPFAGLGATAQILDQCIAGLRHTMWDRDSVCVQYLKDQGKFAQLVDNSFFKLQDQDLTPFRAIMLDMSVNTIKTPTTKTMWEKVATMPLLDDDGFIWFTDTACHKMHLNWKSYARDFGHEIEPHNLSYMEAYSNWLETNVGLVVTAAMAEAGMTYAIAKKSSSKNKRFSFIPYV